MLYYRITHSGNTFVGAYAGQTQATVEAMLTRTYPGATWEKIDESEYNAFVQEHLL